MSTVNLNLNSYYAYLNRSILLAQSYTEIPEFSFIIKSCRLKPIKYVYNNASTTLYKHWVDEYNNSLKIVRNKRLKIFPNDLSLSPVAYTDLFYGLSLDKIAKMSRFIYLCIGKDEDLKQDCCILSLLGIDDYFRTYLLLYGEWYHVSPLCMGLRSLKLIANNLDMKYFREFSFKENICVPCADAKVWLSCMPANKDFLSMLEKQYGAEYSKLYKENQ